MLCLIRIVEGFGTSFEPGQPAHPCCLTWIYTTIGCSDSYFDIDTDMSSGTLIRLNKICPTKHNNCAVKQLHVFVNLIFLSKTCTNIYLSNPVLP